MVVPVSAQISKLRPCPRPPALLTTHFLLPLCPLPTTHYPLSSHLHHVASISLPFSVASAYLPSPRGCAPHAHQIFSVPRCLPVRQAGLCLPRPGRGGNSHVLSSLPPLCRSLRSFRHAFPLFSIVCSLFLQNTQGVGVSPLYSLGALPYPGGV